MAASPNAIKHSAMRLPIRSTLNPLRRPGGVFVQVRGL
jgi:hypothetical protein